MVCSRPLVCVITSLALGLAAASSPAAKPSAKASNTKASASQAAAEVKTLQQAYSLLMRADHDYQGHRARAMRHIEAACRILCGSAKGDGQGEEAQSQSDGQLQQAQSLLAGVEPAIAAKNPRAGQQINKSLQELATALSVN